MFWYHVCALAVYLINRMPTKTLVMCSPFEKLHHKLPSLEYLRIFGCVCYPLMTLYRADKLQPKTMRCVFLSIVAGYKGFICYNLTTRKMIILRHIFFDEQVFPYASLNSSPHMNSKGSQISPATTTSPVQPCSTLGQSLHTCQLLSRTHLHLKVLVNILLIIIHFTLIILLLILRHLLLHLLRILVLMLMMLRYLLLLLLHVIFLSIPPLSVLVQGTHLILVQMHYLMINHTHKYISLNPLVKSMFILLLELEFQLPLIVLHLDLLVPFQSPIFCIVLRD